MRVVFWNRKWNGGAERQSGYLDRLRWDVLALAEVTRSARKRFEAVLGSAAGFTLDVVDVRDRRYPHGLALFVRQSLVVDSFQPFPATATEYCLGVSSTGMIHGTTSGDSMGPILRTGSSTRFARSPSAIKLPPELRIRASR